MRNTVWTCSINPTCVDTLKIFEHKSVANYSCETEFTYQGDYAISKNVVTIIQKDNSHDEDGGKLARYRMKFQLKRDKLFPLSHEVLVNGKWRTSKATMRKDYIFARVKK
jgi:hypothetical protein